MIKGILRLENSAYPPRCDIFVLEVETVMHALDGTYFDCIYRGDTSINFNLYEMMSFSFSGEGYKPCILEGCEPWKFGKGLVLHIKEKTEEKTMEHRRVATSYGNRAFEPSYRLDIKRIVVNGPATIVLWNDGSKTVVKLNEDDPCNWCTAVAYALAKKHFGTNSAFKKKVMKKIDFASAYVFNKEDANHDHA